MPEPFHDAMQAMLGGDPSALNPWLAGDERSRAGLSVYRNTVAKGRIDALAGLFPTVQRLVGGDWFREAALGFSETSLPDSPVLDDYGGGFPAWLAGFLPARDLPCLAPVARIDLAWSRAHRAPDAPVLKPADVAGLPPARLFAARAVLHPSLQMFWFDWTVASIWLANRPDATPDAEVAWCEAPEGLLILRPAMTVTPRRLSRSEWCFLDACRADRTLGQAATAALRPDPTADLSQIFAALLGAGVFTRLEQEPARP